MPFEQEENEQIGTDAAGDQTESTKDGVRLGEDRGEIFTPTELEKELKRRKDDPNWYNEQK